MFESHWRTLIIISQAFNAKKKLFPKSKLINFFYNRGFSQVARFYFFSSLSFHFCAIADAFSSSSSFFVLFLFYFGLVLPKVSIFSHRTFKGMLSNGKRCYIDTTPHTMPMRSHRPEFNPSAKYSSPKIEELTQTMCKNYDNEKSFIFHLNAECFSGGGRIMRAPFKCIT